MDIIVCIVSFIISGLCVAGIYIIKKNSTLKKQEGKMIFGKKVSCRELWGTPNRYIVGVEFVANNIVNRKKLITTDRRITNYTNNSQILLIYMEKKNKVYWADEKSIENVIIIILLAFICMFAIILASVLALRMFV